MKTYKAAVGIRSDMLYCPLPVSIDSYWTCEPNCAHCFARRLNRTWGWDFRAADVEAVKRKLLTKKGKSPLHRALQLKKTIRLGSRSDPFQDCELKHKVSTEIVKFLVKKKWDVVIQTKFPRRAWELTGLGKNCTVMAVIMPGLEKDWEILEFKRTEKPIRRIKMLSYLQKKGFRVGANGEPFIPGYHTVEQFEETIKLLKEYGIKSYNTYNLHMNDYVVKNLFNLGLDIEKIWYMNHDEQWRPILRQLLDICNKYDIILGCPDFVNSGWEDVQKSNTCCGLDVKNPCTFNTHHFKLAVQKGESPLELWEGVGKYEEGKTLVEGNLDNAYTLKDIVGNLGEGELCVEIFRDTKISQQNNSRNASTLSRKAESGCCERKGPKK
jgi:DNA repair photolyase